MQSLFLYANTSVIFCVYHFFCQTYFITTNTFLIICLHASTSNYTLQENNIIGIEAHYHFHTNLVLPLKSTSPAQ